MLTLPLFGPDRSGPVGPQGVTGPPVQAPVRSRPDRTARLRPKPWLCAGCQERYPMSSGDLCVFCARAEAQREEA